VFVTSVPVYRFYQFFQYSDVVEESLPLENVGVVSNEEDLLAKFQRAKETQEVFLRELGLPPDRENIIEASSSMVFLILISFFRYSMNSLKILRMKIIKWKFKMSLRSHNRL
jgi:hypothetical protein